MLMTGGHTGLLGIVTKPCCQLQRNKTNNESKFSPKMTVKCQKKVLKCEKPEVQSSREVPHDKQHLLKLSVTGDTAMTLIAIIAAIIVPVALPARPYTVSVVTPENRIK